MNSNEKAKLTASLGLCLVERNPSGTVVGGIAPAQGGQMAGIKLHRHPSSIQVTSCYHHQVGGGKHWCEAFQQGYVCYHAKALLIQAADETGFDLSFSDEPKDGSVAVYVHPGKIIYMLPTVRPKPQEELPREEPVRVELPKEELPSVLAEPVEEEKPKPKKKVRKRKS